MVSAYNQLHAMLLTVAQALGAEMLREVAFVGGCTTGLLLTDEFSRDSVRYTDDVDLIINVVGFPSWVDFQGRLRARGFRESLDDEVNCRMRLGELKVDFMPDDAAILGFSNRWYAEGFAAAQPYELAEGLTIQLLTAPYFVATKMEAYLGRGNNDPMGSHDLEDILNIFDGRAEIVGEIAASAPPLRRYLASQIEILLGHAGFGYAVQSSARGDRDREELIFRRLDAVRNSVNEVQ